MECGDETGHGRKRGRQGRGIRLSSVLPDARFVACDDVLATGCHDKASRCRPGDLFVARLSEDEDGHEAVAEAVARGVSGILAERMVPSFGVPLCLVPDTAAAMTLVVHALHGRPAERLEIVAVTGTSGKTTTAWLAASVLAEAGLRVGVLSDLGFLDGDAETAVRPEPLDDPHVFAGWLGRLAATGCSHAVVEVSSRMLARESLAGIDCGVAAITNLGRAHLDLHGSEQAYHAVKARIVSSLAADGGLVLNLDDPRLAALAAKHAGRVIGTGLKTPADFMATPVERSLDGQTFLLRSGEGMMPLAVSTPVASFARNALVAGAIGSACGIELSQIARGLEAAASVAGRLERIDRGQEFAAFHDGPTSGHQIASTLASLRHLTPGRLVAVADESNAAALGGEWRRFASRAMRWCDEAVVVPSRLPTAAATSSRFISRIDRLLSGLSRGDCLLVLGSPAVAPDPFDPSGERMAATLVEGWIQMACPPAWPAVRRRAA